MQDEPRRLRGRPRSYDAEAALARATEAFWHAGFAATSLDDLCEATGMNRPSLYGAFGDKRALYLRAVERYTQNGRRAMDEALAYERPIEEALARVYASALSLYFSGGGAARGCFLIGTAATEAAANPEVRARLGSALREFDRAFEGRLRHAQAQGELDPDADPGELAKIASAVLHTLALRSRAGDSRVSLRATADAAVRLICGNRPASGAKRLRGKKPTARRSKMRSSG
jgi:AcrR family transcriptional regulator